MADDLDQLRASYGAIAGTYADSFAGELAHKPLDRALLGVVVEERPPESTIADVGCGPGHVTRYLAGLGARVVGVDVSPGMVEVARQRNPGITFIEGSMTDLPVRDGAWGAVVAFYSIIHLASTMHDLAVRELARTLTPSGLLLLSFHVGEGVIHRDEMLGKPVQLDFHLIRSRDMVAACEAAGLTVQLTLERQPHLAVEAPTTRGYVLAKKEH